MVSYIKPIRVKPNYILAKYAAKLPLFFLKVNPYEKNHIIKLIPLVLSRLGRLVKVKV